MKSNNDLKQIHANFYDGWTDRQDESRRREKIQHKKGQTYLFSGLLKYHLKISFKWKI
jgi:hypothetical protein